MRPSREIRGEGMGSQKSEGAPPQRVFAAYRRATTHVHTHTLARAYVTRAPDKPDAFAERKKILALKVARVKEDHACDRNRCVMYARADKATRMREKLIQPRRGERER